MSIYELISDFRCPYFWNDIEEVISKWERWLDLSEWGPSWEGGYLIRLRNGKLVHIQGWNGIPQAGYGHGDRLVTAKIVTKIPDNLPWIKIGLGRS